MANKIVNAGISPYLIVDDTKAAIDFYCSVFGAVESFRLADPSSGKIGHAELQFGPTRLMIADEYPDFGSRGPSAFGGSPVSIHLDLVDVDSVFAKAIEAGATELRPIKDEFHGNRGGVLVDPFGHTWHLQTEFEKVSSEEMQRRWNRFISG